MLKRITVKNLSAFAAVDLHFASGLNVIVGENGCGKPHLLKVAYAVIANSAEESGESNSNKPTKALLSKTLANKLIHVLRPESLGRIARRKQGRERCDIRLEFDDCQHNCQFDFSSSSKTEVQISVLPQQWQTKAPVFLPTREVLSIYPGFVALYDGHYVAFDEIYRDTCTLLGAPPLKGTREKDISILLTPLEDAMGGKVILDKNGRFYLNIIGTGKLEMPLVSEGMRKLAMLARLIATGSLLDEGYLFWDEPESNLNPKLIQVIARVITHLCQHGIQVFIATHSYFLIKELDIIKQANPIEQCFFSISRKSNNVSITSSATLSALENIVTLDEELAQYDREMDAAHG